MTRAGLSFFQLAGSLACAALVSCATGTSQESTVTLQGRLVPGTAGTRDAMRFKTESSGVYTLVSNRMSSALFIDPDLQAKTLLLKGRVLPERKFEVTGNLRSVRDGQTNELFYFCGVCVIKGIDPGPCMCCREPVVLMEEPEVPSKNQTRRAK